MNVRWGDNVTYRYFRWKRIKWKVLQVSNSKALLMADMAIDCEAFNWDDQAITWETSSIRSWLNSYSSSQNKCKKDYTCDSFINLAFNQAEQDAMLSKKVSTPNNTKYNTSGGNDTTDKVFLLSVGEMKNRTYGFCPDVSIHSPSRQVFLTKYAIARGAMVCQNAYNHMKDGAIYWLRSPGKTATYKAYGDEAGSIDSSAENGYLARDHQFAVVPAIYLDLTKTSVIFTSDDNKSGNGGLEKKHNWEKNADAAYLKKAAYCGRQAEYFYSCKDCHCVSENSFFYGNKPEHTKERKSYPEYLKSPATCTQEAVYYYSCSLCNVKLSETYKHYGSIKGHEYVDNPDPKYLKSPATCTSAAYYYYHCPQCDTTLNESYYYGSKLPHKKSKNTNERYLKTPAHCTTPAVYVYSCADCGEKMEGSFESGKPLGHNPFTNINPNYLAKKATCEHPDSYHYCCIRCFAALDETFYYGEPLPHTEAKRTVKAKPDADGYYETYCTVCSTSISKVKIPKPVITAAEKANYTGMEIKQAVKITDNKGNAIDRNNYVISYKNNINPGQASIIISFKNDYSGSAIRYFTIVKNLPTPDKVASASLKAGKASFTINWKKARKNAAGYQIQYTTDKAFKKSLKTENVTKGSAVSRKITKLKSGKSYYVRIRAYNKDQFKTVYSAWYKVKNPVKVK